MSAALVLRQREAVHLMADAAAYRRDGTLVGVNVTKCSAIPTLMAAVSFTGPVKLGAYFSLRLSHEFFSFDDLVARADDELPRIFEQFAEEEREGDANATLYLIGWHEKQSRPAAYCMNLWTEDSTQIEQILKNSEGGSATQRSKLVEQLFAGTPLPGKELLDAAGFEIYDDDERFIPELDLLHVLEVMRHEQIEGRYWVGGCALLTTIDKLGITQRVVHRWTEDQIGLPITPLPIAWKAWREARVAAKVAAVVPDGLSRLQRERMAKKIRKGTLRCA